MQIVKKLFPICLLVCLATILPTREVEAAPVPVVKTLDGSHVLCKKLYAGQTTEIGNVCLEVLGDSLQTRYQITNTGWTIVQTHFWTGTRIEDLPATRAGNPVPGKFPYKSLTLPASTTSFQQAIPLANMSFTCPTDKDVNYYAAAHAAVRSPTGTAETAWGDGDRLQLQGNWGMYYSYSLSCSNNEVERRCETAFAVENLWEYRNPPSGSSICFLDIAEAGSPPVLEFSPRTTTKPIAPTGDFDRWGWTTGPLAPGESMELDIYAGAGRCVLSNGDHIGNLYVDYGVDGMVSVTYDLFESLEEWGIDALHIYAGESKLPLNVNGDYTVAPGQYTIIKDHVEDMLTDTSTLGPYSGEIYIVAHAAVCRNL